MQTQSTADADMQAVEPKLTRRERRRLDDREAILGAALEVFSERGFEGGTMQEIAEQAEISVGTLYNFFDGKKVLYEELVREYAARLEATLDAALAEGRDEVEKLMNFIRAKGRFLCANIAMARVYFAEMRGQDLNISGGLDPQTKAKSERFRDRLAEVFRSGIEKGLFAPVDPFYMAVSLQTLTTAFGFLHMRDSESHPYMERVDTMAKMFFEGVLIEKEGR